MMFSLTAFLVKSDGSPANGVMSIYDQNNTLVSRVSSVDSVARADLVFVGEGVVSVSSEGLAFPAFSLNIDAEGEGEITITALPVPTVTALGVDWCSVQGTFRDSTGNPASVNMSVLLTSGDYRSSGSIIHNQPTQVSSDSRGEIRLQLLRGRSYEVTYDCTPYEGVETYVVYVPNREYADVYDVLYPYAVAGFIDQPFTGNGDYGLTILLSDGREITKYADLTQYIYSVESENAETILVESEQGAGILRVAGEVGATVNITGNRRGGFSLAPIGTTQLRGDVFLTLVS